MKSRYRLWTTFAVQAAMVAGFAMTLAACSSGGTPQGAASPAATAAAPSSRAAATSAGVAPVARGGSGTSAAGGPRATGAAVPECGAGQLRISETDAEGATGHVAVGLEFTNVGQAGCFAQGYPGVAAATASGHVVANAARTPTGFMSSSGGRVTRVVLDPGQSAYAVTEAEDNAPDGTACAGQAATRLLVTSPDQKVSTSVVSKLRICTAFQVHPIVSSSAYRNR